MYTDARETRNAVPPASPATPPVNTRTTETATTPRTASPAAPAAQREGRSRRIHPLWLAGGVVALFALIFGIGAIAEGQGASSAPSGSSIEEDTIAVIQNVDPSVVQIQASGGNGSSIGSGEILTTSGYIVTNNHVVHGQSTFTVLLSDGRRVSAQLVGEAPRDDLAVLRVNASNLKPIAVGDSSQVAPGEYALALGSPLGLEQSATSGIISALNRQAVETVDGTSVLMTGLIQTSAPINPGNSGGALVNLKGQLVGIPTLAAVDPTTGVAANGIGFAISSNRMETIVKRLTGGAG